jgi:hypothetical protein
MVHPNLFLLGLPKCGTSSLANVLAMHPAILGSVPKETFFLVDRDSPFYKDDSYHTTGNQGWARFFKSEKDPTGIRYFMDATTHLAFQRSAPDVLKHYDNCRLIVVLRNPAERVYSSFNYSKFNLGFIENDITFSKYVDDLLAGNKNMKYILNDSSRFVLSNDLDYSVYVNVLEPWRHFYKENRLYIAIFEEMKESPEEFYSRIFNWLELPGHSIEKRPRNQTYQPQNLAIHRILFSMNRVLRNMPGIRLVKQLYFKYFVKKNVKTQEDKEAIRKLSMYFEQKNKILADLYDVDISRWN